MSIQRLYGLDRSSAQFSHQLDELLHDKGCIDELRVLPEIELAPLVDHLDDVGFTAVILTPLTTPADPDSSRSRRQDIQKVPPGVAGDMWLPESSPYGLCIAWRTFTYSPAARCIWRVL